MQGIRLEMLGNRDKNKGVRMEMRRTRSGKGVKVFVYIYILCKFFSTNEVVSHFRRKICFRKFKVLMLKIVRSIFPKEYLFLQNISPVLLLDHETCALSNEIGF